MLLFLGLPTRAPFVVGASTESTSAPKPTHNCCNPLFCDGSLRVVVTSRGREEYPQAPDDATQIANRLVSIVVEGEVTPPPAAAPPAATDGLPRYDALPHPPRDGQAARQLLDHRCGVVLLLLLPSALLFCKPFPALHVLLSCRLFGFPFLTWFDGSMLCGAGPGIRCWERQPDVVAWAALPPPRPDTATQKRGRRQRRLGLADRSRTAVCGAPSTRPSSPSTSGVVRTRQVAQQAVRPGALM